MPPEYKPLYSQVVALQHRVQDLLDQPSAPQAQSLKREVQRLQDEMETSASPRSLESRIQVIQALLLQIRAGGKVMSYDHIDYLHRLFEELRMSVRKLSKY